MIQFPFGYERIAETTWAYMSSLLMLALFFKFNRFWSVRNFDLVLIILLAPGILMIQQGRQMVVRDAARQTQIAPSVGTDDPSLNNGNIENVDPASGALVPENQDKPKNGSATNESNSARQADEDPLEPAVHVDTRGHRLQRWGFYWLFSVGALFVIRMLLDPRLVRRPLLDPNLSVGGLVFFGCSLMIFLFANIITSQPTAGDLAGAKSALKMLKRESSADADIQQLSQRGPGYAIFNLLPIIPTFSDGVDFQHTDTEQRENLYRYIVAAKSLAIISQVFIVLGLILIGYSHFNSFFSGIGMATIYLVLPYTAIFTGYALHALPAALILWAVLYFKRPLVAGIFIGLAIGVSYYPLFLLPLWISFYWEKGWRPFVVGMVISFVFCAAGLIFTSSDIGMFFDQLMQMFGFMIPRMEGLEGIWALGWDQVFRLPLLVGFVALSVSFVFWPAQKNVGTLISYSCALMVAVQFWHGFDGGLYMAWYLPLALLVIFRPNMDGRVAKTELLRPNDNRRAIHGETPPELLTD